VLVSGLARDYCVGNTALDLARMGFFVVLLEDCTAFVAEESNNAINAKFEDYFTRVYSMKSTDILDESDIEPTDRLYPKIGGACVSVESVESVESVVSDKKSDKKSGESEEKKNDLNPIGGGNCDL